MCGIWGGRALPRPGPLVRDLSKPHTPEIRPDYERARRIVKTIYIGIGSNLGDREQNLHAAREGISAAGLHIARASSIYETAPRDLPDQPWFLNQVVEAETELLPLQLLGKLQKIEKALGRRRVVAKGPRVIDLDILLYGRAVIRHAGLEIPHPRMIERRFVLEPLAELSEAHRSGGEPRPRLPPAIRYPAAEVLGDCEVGEDRETLLVLRAFRGRVSDSAPGTGGRTRLPRAHRSPVFRPP